MLISNYNFIDPGVYAEDYNGDFDIREGIYPDLDGDGYGETHGYRVLPVNQYDIIAYDRTYFANSNTFENGIIYVHRSLESVENEQMELVKGNSKSEDYENTVFEDATNAVIPSGGSQIQVKKTTFRFSY